MSQKKLHAAVCWLIIVFFCGNTLGAELNLICTGEQQYPTLHVKSPYSFKAMFALAEKKYSIDLVQNSDNRPQLYPRDNPWNKEKCQAPYWKLEITDTDLRVITSCNEASYNKNKDFGMIWDISRADGSFTVYEFGEKNATGKCIKASERAF